MGDFHPGYARACDSNHLLSAVDAFQNQPSEPDNKRLGISRYFLRMTMVIEPCSHAVVPFNSAPSTTAEALHDIPISSCVHVMVLPSTDTLVMRVGIA